MSRWFFYATDTMGWGWGWEEEILTSGRVGMASWGGKRWLILSFPGAASGKQSSGVTPLKSHPQGLSAIGLMGLEGKHSGRGSRGCFVLFVRGTGSARSGWSFSEHF